PPSGPWCGGRPRGARACARGIRSAGAGRRVARFRTGCSSVASGAGRARSRFGSGASFERPSIVDHIEERSISGRLVAGRATTGRSATILDGRPSHEDLDREPLSGTCHKERGLPIPTFGTRKEKPPLLRGFLHARGRAGPWGSALA